MSTTSIIVPPPPYQSPFTIQNGLISPIWSDWIKQLYLRAGGASSPSTAGIASAITTLQLNVASNAASIATLSTSTTTLINKVNGLGVGRDL